MTKKEKHAVDELKRRKNMLSTQQFRTFKGQILSGDIQGFEKGLRKALNLSRERF